MIHLTPFIPFFNTVGDWIVAIKGYKDLKKENEKLRRRIKKLEKL